MGRNKGGSGGFFQGRTESCVTGEFMVKNKGGSGGSSKEEVNHVLQGSS